MTVPSFAVKVVVALSPRRLQQPVSFAQAREARSSERIEKISFQRILMPP